MSSESRVRKFAIWVVSVVATSVVLVGAGLLSGLGNWGGTQTTEFVERQRELASLRRQLDSSTTADRFDVCVLSTAAASPTSSSFLGKLKEKATQLPTLSFHEASTQYDRRTVAEALINSVHELDLVITLTTERESQATWRLFLSERLQAPRVLASHTFAGQVRRLGAETRPTEDLRSFVGDVASAVEATRVLYGISLLQSEATLSHGVAYLESTEAKNVQAALVALRFLRMLGAGGPAENVASELRNTTTGNPKVLFEIGVLSLLNGRAKEARKVALEVLDIAPDDSHARHLLALALLCEGEYKDAVKAMEGMAEEERTSGGFLSTYLEVLDRAGEYSRELLVAESILASGRKEAVAHLAAGRAIRGGGDEEGAVKYFRDASTLDPDAAVAHMYLAVILIGRGGEAVPEGLDEAYIALSMAPNSRVVTASMPDLLSEAQPYWDEWLDKSQINRSESVLSLLSAFFHVSQMDWKAVIEKARRAYTADPTLASAHILEGWSHWALGRRGDGTVPDSRFNHYRTAARIAPNSTIPLVYYARAAIEEKDFDTAAQHLRRAICLDPFYVEPYLVLGDLELEQGTSDANTLREVVDYVLIGLRHCQRGIPRMPKEFEARLCAVAWRIYERLGEHEKAREFAQKARAATKDESLMRSIDLYLEKMGD